MEKIITKNEIETFELGFKLAKRLKGGEVIMLCGNLGAGKTKLLQGLAKGLGVKGRVNSPTFNILKLYKTSGNKNIKSFCHVDTYRLRNENDLITLGVEDYFRDKEMVTAIEWAEKVKKIWPKNSINISLNHVSESERLIIIK